MCVFVWVFFCFFFCFFFCLRGGEIGHSALAAIKAEIEHFEKVFFWGGGGSDHIEEVDQM